jgi:hypothetical protein
MRIRSRRQFLAIAGLTAVAGCAGGASESDAGGTEKRTETAATTDDGTATTDDGTATTDDGTATAGAHAVPTSDDRLALPMSPAELREEAASGGPPKDGIPSIDSPEFVSADDAGYLEPGDPVFGVARDGATKAYPQKILVKHEIVNDELAGTPVSVTYCPLTGTVQGFERGETTFGVSGRLINNNLVMYDRETEAWWPQILATSIPGPWNENPKIASLREFRLVWTTWERWQTHHPETAVLSTENEHIENYSRDPYGGYNPRQGYYENGRLLFPPLEVNDEFDAKAVVMGARTTEGSVAFLKDTIRTDRLMSGAIGETPVVATYDPRYDTAYVYRNPEGLTYEYDDGTVVASDGASHDPDGLPLDRIHTFDAMWFAWAGYYPDTNVYA